MPTLPRVVQLTPPGRGAVATLLVEGPGALQAIQARFRSKRGRGPGEWPADRPAFGYLQIDDCAREEVVLRFRSPESIELHCHGGRAAAAAIQQVLVDQHFEPVAWRDWARQHYTDPITAAAAVALADAPTQRTAAVLLDQYWGALRRDLTAIREALCSEDLSTAQQLLDHLSAQAQVGRHLVTPWRVVLAGAPNVGKSSLVNALAGYPRAVVHPTPGTTRDVVTASVVIDGWPVELSDTAGLRHAKHAVERAGVGRAMEQLAAADLVVLVFDRTQSWSDPDAASWDRWPDALVVHNKCDLPPASSPRPAGLATSALGGEGIDALLHAIARRLVPNSLQPGDAVPFTDNQIAVIRRAATAALEGALRDADALLATLRIPPPLEPVPRHPDGHLSF